MDNGFSGAVDSYTTYTLVELGRRLGFTGNPKNCAQSAKNLCDSIGCPVLKVGSKSLVSGRRFNQSIEGFGDEGCDSDS